MKHTEEEIARIFLSLKVDRIKEKKIPYMSVYFSLLSLFVLFVLVGFWDWIRGR